MTDKMIGYKRDDGKENAKDASDYFAMTLSHNAKAILLITLLTALSGAAWFASALESTGSNDLLIIDFDNTNRTSIKDNSTQNNAVTFTNGTFNDGTIIGSAAWNASGYYGGALSFDGVNDNVTTPITTTMQNFTVEAWVNSNANINADNLQYIVSKRSYNAIAQTDFPFQLSANAAATRFFVGIDSGNDTASFDATATADGQYKNAWHYVAATYNTTTLIIYVDGLLINSTSVVVTLSSNSQPYTIGSAAQEAAAQTGLSRFNGTIDAVRIWNRTLSDIEINQSMNSALPPPLKNLVSAYNFEEQSGTRVFDENNRRWGIHGSAMYFNAANGRNTSLITFNGVAKTAEQTLAMWLYLPGAHGRIMGYEQQGAGLLSFQEFPGVLANGTVNYVINGGTINIHGVNGTFAFNEWQHLTFTRSGATSGTAKVYLNGRKVGEGSYSGVTDFTANTQPVFLMGDPSFTTYPEGAADDIRWYNSVLTDAQIKELYSCEMPTFPYDTWNVTGVCNIMSESRINNNLMLHLRGNLTVWGGNLTLGSIDIEQGSWLAVQQGNATF